jgi:muconolactone delta-isomerase
VSLAGTLYRLARLASTVGAIASGNPHRIARRARNVATARILARAGLWRRLWR